MHKSSLYVHLVFVSLYCISEEKSLVKTSKIPCKFGGYILNYYLWLLKT